MRAQNVSKQVGSVKVALAGRKQMDPQKGHHDERKRNEGACLPFVKPCDPAQGRPEASKEDGQRKGISSSSGDIDSTKAPGGDR